MDAFSGGFLKESDFRYVIVKDFPYFMKLQLIKVGLLKKLTLINFFVRISSSNLWLFKII